MFFFFHDKIFLNEIKINQLDHIHTLICVYTSAISIHYDLTMMHVYLYMYTKEYFICDSVNMWMYFTYECVCICKYYIRGCIYTYIFILYTYTHRERFSKSKYYSFLLVSSGPVAQPNASESTKKKTPEISHTV